MYLFLLKKALPFTLTFLFGAALSGLVGLFGSPEKKGEWALGTRTYEYGRGCRTRRHRLVAESRPLAVLFKPDARYPLAPEGRVRVNVTFGADGQVKEVRPLMTLSGAGDASLVEVKAMWEAVEKAARQIRFTPETINGVPVSVEREVEMRFLPE
jgi:hypothetical protein